MASLEKRGEFYRAKFRYGGQQFGVTLEADNLKDANSLLGKIEYNLTLVKRGTLVIPPGADVGRFLLSDGKLTGKPEALAPLPLSEFFQRYRDRVVKGKDASTSRVEKVHMGHLERILGVRFNVRTTTTEALQGYVDQRSRERGRDGNVSADTIHKEIGTFSTIWNNWGKQQKLVFGDAPTKGLNYEKSKEKPPFQTWEQIERTISRGKLKPEQQEELWDALYLSQQQINDVLAYVKEHATAPWVYPAVAFVAYTGARRGEMMRSELDDIDFDGQTVHIREKKRDRERQFTFRSVPLWRGLAEILHEWFSAHPGGRLTFCSESDVAITDGLARHYFDQAFIDGKWKVLRGWHVFRHSFISICACKGTDQRMIDDWVGHQTDAMRRRYRHLFPSVQQQAMKSVFDGK